MSTTATIRSRIAGLKRRTRMDPSWQVARELAGRIAELLADIAALDAPPETAVELLASFFETDRAVFETCDDSNGYVSYQYRVTAAKLFAERAAACGRRPWLTDLVSSLVLDNEYGARDTLLDGARTFLPDTELRALAVRFEQISANEPDDGRDALGIAAECAREIPDPALFERLALARSPGGHTSAWIEIAGCWLASGDPHTALARFANVPDDGFMTQERDTLELDIRRALGDQDGVEKVVLRIAVLNPLDTTLEAAVNALGESRRGEIVAHIAAAIRDRREFRAIDAVFLLDAGLRAEAVAHTLAHTSDVNGRDYDDLPPLAERFDAEGEPLAATVIYRALLKSLLERKATTAYGHGARQLRLLDALAPRIDDWHAIEPHAEFDQRLRLEHRFKTSFWAKHERVDGARHARRWEPPPTGA